MTLEKMEEKEVAQEVELVEKDYLVQKFIKVIKTVFGLKINPENDLRSVLKYYEDLAKMNGPFNDMVLLIKSLSDVEEALNQSQIDYLYNRKLCGEIYNLFNEYFLEARTPSDEETEKFYSYLQEKINSLNTTVMLAKLPGNRASN